MGSRDVTSSSILPAELELVGEIVGKQTGVLAGLDVARLVFRGCHFQED